MELATINIIKLKKNDGINKHYNKDLRIDEGKDEIIVICKICIKH